MKASRKWILSLPRSYSRYVNVNFSAPIFFRIPIANRALDIDLEPREIVTLQHISRRFLALGRDESLWREQCFQKSSFLTTLRRRQGLIISESAQESQFRDLARALASGNGLDNSRLSNDQDEAMDTKAKANERIRIMENWDPTFPEEKIRWYDEYIARNAPISTSWLQQPRHQESSQREYLEIRGFGLYTPKGEDDSTMVVAPLDDGSVCVWDISRTHDKRGSIVARSKPGVLSVDKDSAPDAATKRSKMINTGVTECVSVDSMLRRAYFAVQSGKSFHSHMSRAMRLWPKYAAPAS